MVAENIDDVVDGLAEIVREASRTGDRIGYFAALYRQVTADVRAAIRAGRFDDGPRMDALELLDIRAALLTRLVARPGGLVRPAIQLIRSAEDDDVPTVITHLDNAVPQPHG